MPALRNTWLAWLLALLVAAVDGFAPATAAAHTRSQSFSTWSVEADEVRGTFSVRAREVTRLPQTTAGPADLDGRLEDHLERRIEVRRGERLCDPLQPPRSLAARPGFARVELRFRCPGQEPLAFRVGAFFEAVPSHVHFARVRLAGEAPVERLLTAADPVLSAAPGQPPAQAASFAGYLRLGVEHIAGGVDHLAFLLGLLLLTRRPRELVALVTGFTLGHSLTLSLAVLGCCGPDVQMVEALIGFTIALVAVEASGPAGGPMRRRAGVAFAALAALAAGGALAGRGPAPLAPAGPGALRRLLSALGGAPRSGAPDPPAVTASFGLVHGFGFAGALLDLGVPQDRVVPALLGFNLGVELGQIAIVAVAWLAGAKLLARWRSFPGRAAADATAAALCALGVYWFVARAYATDPGAVLGS